MEWADHLRVPPKTEQLVVRVGGAGGGNADGTPGGSGYIKVEHKPFNTRRYLPTLSDLVDRLTIVQQKAIFIADNKDAYMSEMSDIMHDIDLILEGLSGTGAKITAAEIRAICVIQLTNRFIWENESKARQGGPEQDKLLKLTHSINGVRNAAKNELAALDGGRKDFKIDCFASELVAEFGAWDVFNGGEKKP